MRTLGAMGLESGTKVGSYRVERLIGRGGMGEVYLATDERLGRAVALKLLTTDLAADPEARQRFVEEARAAASLDHPHVVPVYEAGEDDGRAFVAMRFVDGSDLDAIIRLRGPLDPAVAVGLLSGVAAALDAAHARGLVHRDVKPANILVAEGSDPAHAYLGDFGLAKMLAGGAGRTQTGVIVGSVDYLAPEGIEGRPVDGRADVYSLACVIYTCLTARRPYVRDTEVGVLWAHVGAAPPRLSDSHPGLGHLDAVLGRALSKSPDDRYPSAGALIVALQAALAEPGSAPPPRGVTARPSTLVGRDREAEAVASLVRENRLVTLVGPGGIGKTRLAREVADRVAGAMPGGSIWVGLEALTDASLVAPAIDQALIAASGTDPARSTDLLLVLDNFEQLLDAAASVPALLATSPGLRILVTSREPLRVEGEHVFEVGPISTDASVGLFVRLAQAADASFESDASVAQICERLDGLPLAIELAAARVRVLGTHSLLDRLGRRLPLLTGGRRDAPARQQTLEATIAWSYDLLSEAEQHALRRLAVFAGGWTVEAAEAVAGVDLGTLAALLDKSVLRRVGDVDHVRFEMLETIREFALSRLTAAGEAEETAARHAAYFRQLAQRAEVALDEGGDARGLAIFETEVGNFRASLAWTRDNGDLETHARLVADLGRLWFEQMMITEALLWTRPVLDNRDLLEPGLRMRVLRAGERLAISSSGSDGSGGLDEAAGLAEERLALALDHGDNAQAALALNNLGIFASEAGDRATARARYAESAALFRKLGDHRETLPLGNLGSSHIGSGDFSTARPYLEKALAVERSINDELGAGYTLGILAGMHLVEGRIEDAETNYRAVAETALAIYAHSLLIGMLEGMAGVAALTGHPFDAAAIHGTLDAERRRQSIGLDLVESMVRDRTASALREALTADEIAAAAAEGARAELETVARKVAAGPPPWF